MSRRLVLVTIDIVTLAVVLFGIQHFTHHWCIAFSTIAALFYLEPNRGCSC